MIADPMPDITISDTLDEYTIAIKLIVATDDVLVHIINRM